MIQSQPDRLDRIESILAVTAEQQMTNTSAIAQLGTKLDQLSDKVDNLTDNVSQLTDNTDRVLARSAVLDDVVLEIRESSERHQRNFEQHQLRAEQNQQIIQENQRTTNAALARLEAILMQLVRRNGE